jgi:hypothetical protein
MDRRYAQAMLGLLGMILAFGCTSPGAGTSATMAPGTALAGATSFETYGDAFCSAWRSLFTAVGNPDTAAGSELSRALDAAVEAGDDVKAARLAEQINDELETGRMHVAVAAAWLPAAQSMRHLDRLFLAMQAKTNAHVPLANGAPDAAHPQRAFEQAGGIDAWTGFLDAYLAMEPERPAGGAAQCEGLPIGP